MENQGFHKVERFVKALDKKPSPGPFHASLEGEKRILSSHPIVSMLPVKPNLNPPAPSPVSQKACETGEGVPETGKFDGKSQAPLLQNRKEPILEKGRFGALQQL